MAGHIRDLRKRKGGYKGRNYWQARWTNPDDPSDTKDKGFRTKAEAEVWIEQRNAQSRDGTLIDDRSAKCPLKTVAAEWQASRVKASPKTRVGHDNILSNHILAKFGERRISSLGADTIQEWTNALAKTHAPPTVHNIFAVLRLIMAFAVRRRYVAVNPCTDIELPQTRRRKVQPLEHTQVIALANAMPDAMSRVAVLTAAYAGVRAGELWALKRDDVKLRELVIDEAIKEVTVKQAQDLPDGYERLSPSLIIGPTKTDQVRRIAIPGFLADELAALMTSKPTGFIFTDSDGGPIRHTSFYRNGSVTRTAVAQGTAVSAPPAVATVAAAPAVTDADGYRTIEMPVLIPFEPRYRRLATGANTPPARLSLRPRSTWAIRVHPGWRRPAHLCTAP